ncbi:MAG: HK97 family phage prohead protease [Rickettsiales endosymbiont of Dermacentor nuttalli]
MDRLSIGYTLVEYEIEGNTQIRILTKIDLWEISLVTLPANIHACVISLKNYYGNDKNSVL